MTDEIWLPKTETKVTVRDGDVTVWDEMVMRPQPVARPTLGFGGRDDEADGDG